MMTARVPSLLGAGLLLAGLGVAAAGDGWAGWLAAFAFWSAMPIGALVIALMLRLIPGAWRAALGGAAEALLVLTPLAALAILPILAALPALYRWTALHETGFRGAYLGETTFVLRTVIFFALAGGLAMAAIRRPAWSAGAAAAGLIALVLADTIMATDWLLSRDPDFHSSGFGLYVLSLQATVAFAAAVLIRARRATPDHVGVLGALLLTALLLWAYFAFMHYFISWSENLPASAAWYQRRGAGLWSAVEIAVAVSALAPAFLLLFAPLRHGRAALAGLAALVLAGKALECAWLAIPDGGGGAAATLTALLAHAGFALLALGLVGGVRPAEATP
jgi:hypothetical protein